MITKAQAHEQGRLAFIAGKPRMANPHNYENYALRHVYCAWDDGWVSEWIKNGGVQ
jgi:hypothetical protein